MKSFKRLIALLLALVMVFALCACNGGDGKDNDKDSDKGEKIGSSDKAKDDDKKELTDSERVVGKWVGAFDMRYAFVGNDSEEAELLLEYFDFKDVYCYTNIELTADGRYSIHLSADEAALKGAFKEGMRAYLTDFLTPYGYSIADAATAEDMTEDEYIEALVDASFDVDEMFSDSDESGYYIIEDGKLYLLKSEDDEDRDNYLEFHFEGDDMIITKNYDSGESVDENILPLTMKRQ